MLSLVRLTVVPVKYGGGGRGLPVYSMVGLSVLPVKYGWFLFGGYLFKEWLGCLFYLLRMVGLSVFPVKNGWAVCFR